MAITTDWDPGVPLGTDKCVTGTLGVTSLQTLKVGFHERARNGGQYWPTASATTIDAKDGRFSCGVEATNTLTFWDTEGSNAAIQVNDGADQGVTFGDGTTVARRYGVYVGGSLTAAGAVYGNYLALTLNGTATYALGTNDRFMRVASTSDSTGAMVLKLPYPGTVISGQRITVSYVNTSATTRATLTLRAADSGGYHIDVGHVGNDYPLTTTASNVPMAISVLECVGDRLAIGWRVIPM